MSVRTQIGAVVIGRNEGARLVRCLASLQDQTGRIVYVDSGSDDDSVAAARDAGAQVVLLDTDQPFTAARARNAGLDQLAAGPTPPAFVQFIDGDCELQPGWTDTALAFLLAEPKVAVACGRRRERFPDASVYNRLIDAEWDTPIGEARACGGDSVMRIQAVRDAGGFNAALIAGEEPELCLRLRDAGWKVWRLETEMTLHDADITRFSQWWQRNRRTGHAYAEGAGLHGGHNIARRRRALIWGMGVPLAATLGLAVTPWALAILLLWPVQVLRLIRRGMGRERALFTTLGKIPEAVGVVGYHLRRLRGGQNTLIEYK